MRSALIALVTLLLACAALERVLSAPTSGAERGGALAAALGAGAVPPTGPVDPAVATGERAAAKVQPGVFIVVLDGEPLATYEGRLRGLIGTSPSVTGEQRLDTVSAASRRYLDYLDRVQAEALDRIEAAIGHSASVRFRYRYVQNGFALALSAGDAVRIAALPGVSQVTPSLLMPLATDVGPRLIGAPGVWDGSALAREAGVMGEGIVVGIVDTGINVDHPSFAEVDKYGYEHLNPKGRPLGFCDPDHPRFDPALQCNDKLIGLYSFIDEPPANSFVPEDANGHGSHTASTVAGNFVSVPMQGPTIVITREISGVAPHANIVAYDACGNQGCPDEATLAALDQAVADSVDVVNYSISTSRGAPWSQPVMQAFYRLRRAGVFAAVSAGNNGPGASTTGALPPWVMTVGAATNDRVLANSLTELAGGDAAAPGDLDGGSLTAGYGPASIVYAGSGAYVNAGGQVDDGRCNQGFPAGTWNGEIVVCDRGEVARVTKATNVQAGGAGGFVLVNMAAEGEALEFDGYALPGVHLGFAAGGRLKTWLATGSGHSGRITGTLARLDGRKADVMAGFSSRGPAMAGACCRRPDAALEFSRLFGIMKPDVLAPGVDVLAAVASPEGSTEPEFGRLSGTSMSGPHGAGAAALVLAARPEWTVAEVQSALMTTAITATVRKQDGLTPADPFDRGAGRISVDRAVAAGLVLDATAEQMDAADPLKGGDVRQVNLASLTDPWCLGSCGWTRVVSGTLDRAMEWKVEVQPDAGAEALAIEVVPDHFRVAPGRRQQIEVTAVVEGLAPEAWRFPTLVLTPADPSVPTAHMPMAIRPVIADIAPVHVAYTEDGTGRSVMAGSRAAVPGPLQLEVAGLARGTTHLLSLHQDPTPSNRLDLITGTALVTIAVPLPAARIVATIDSSEAEDVDLFMGLDGNRDGLPQSGEQLCASADESWTEYCELASSEPDLVYWVVVQNFTGSEDQPDDIVLVTGAVPALDAGNLSVTGPERIVPGETFDLLFDWSVPGLAPGDTWFAQVAVGSGPGAHGDLGHIAFDLVARSIPPTPTLAPTPPPTPDPRAHNVLLPALRRARP